MKNNYLFAFLISSLLFGGHAMAQSNLGPRKDTAKSTSTGQNDVPIKDNKLKRYVQGSASQTVLPVESQIHSPYRWYAIENADNQDYWKAVDTERIWIELEIGQTISDSKIAEFLVQNDLFIVLNESQNKDVTNYYIFQNENNTPAQVAEMAREASAIDGILFLEPSAIYKKSLVPNDPLWENQWGPYASYFDEAWDYGTGGNSQNVVAVIDNACDWNHEDLYDQVWYGYDYVYGSFDIAPVSNSHNHGTHVTGTVAATTGNGIGVAGMVNDTVYFAKVGDDQDGLVDQAIVDAIYDIASIDRITAINMSLGSDAPNSAIEQACNFAWNNGKLLIVASGNNGQGFVGFPAAFASCVAIGSVGADGTNIYLTGYSQYGPEQELCASGGDENTGFGIISTLPGNEYGTMQGTSMAAPHVTGLAGLLKNLNPDLTNVDIRNILAATAFDMGDAGWDMYHGYGLINALGAVEAAIGVSTGINDKRDDTLFEVYPNPATDQLAIQLKSEMNGAEIEIFDITGQRVDALSNSTNRRITVDINNLSPGVYIVALRSEGSLSTARFVKQ